MNQQLAEKEGYEIISQSDQQKQIAFKSRDGKWKFLFHDAFKGFRVISV